MDKKKSILLVEDDESLGFVVSDNLRQKFNVDLAKDGKKGLEQFKNNKYDICLLDVMLPELDGFALGKSIRTLDQQIPIIFLTAKSMEQDKIEGFQIGADDYITKPFSMAELELRIEAILKRTGVTNNEQISTDMIGKYQFNFQNQLLTFDKEGKTLTKKEAHVLKLLAESKNNVVKREDILTEVWGEDDYFLGRSLDVFITRLRKYLKQDASIQIINVHGVGFKLEINE